MLKKFLIILVAVGVYLTACTSKKKEENPEMFNLTKVGQNVPDFSVSTIDGKTFKMSELKGKTVLLIFFSTSCSVCLKEMPQIESEIWKEFKSDDFIILAIGRKHSMEEIVKFNAEKGFTFPIGPDPEKKIYDLFFTKYVPRNVLVDKEGKIIYQKQGYDEKDAKKLTKLIDLESQK